MKRIFPHLVQQSLIALLLVAVLMYTAGVVSPAHAATGPLCRVDASADGNNDGNSWADAYTDLQSALGDANCAEIWVAAGTYKPHNSNQMISFQLKNSVKIYGGFAGTEISLKQRNPEVNITILSGDLFMNDNNNIDANEPTRSENSYQVVVSDGVNETAILNGFTIKSGNANGSFPLSAGGGMYNTGSSPTLTNIIFSRNTAQYGGGMYNSTSSPSLTNVTFISNSAKDSGGMYNYQSNPMLTNVTFTSNRATTYGGGMYNYQSAPKLTNVTFIRNSTTEEGGGMYSTDSSPSLAHVTFSGNSAEYGGGMYNYNDSSPSLANVTFSGNSAQYGGGIYNSITEAILINVTISGNSATYYGGGMYNYASNPTLINVTLSGNSATIDGGGMHNHHSRPWLTNVIIANSTSGGDCANFMSVVDMQNSLIEDGLTCVGTNINNLTGDPKLGPLADNGGSTKTHALLFGSKAIDMGDAAACANTSTVKNLDQRGVARPLDGNGDGLAVCDIGAFEAQIHITRSSGANDGWVLESSEISSRGGTLNKGAATFNVGDDTANKQYRAILSFNTTLPAGAVITNATLKFRYAGKVGTSPFSTHGKLLVDVKKGAFSNNATLQLSDFNAAANKNALFSLGSSTNWFTKVFAPAQLTHINKTGVTQFRLRFTKDDNNDLGADFIKIHSGSATNATYRPQLIVEYYVP